MSTPIVCLISVVILAAVAAGLWSALYVSAGCSREEEARDRAARGRRAP